MLFRRNNTKGATPASISSSSGGGPTSSSSSSKDSRWWWTASSNGPHPVTLCLLVYLAIFQLTIYRAKTRTNDQENEKISSTGGGMLLTATSSTTSGAAATPSRLLPVVTSSLDCHNQSQQQQLQQKQQRRGVGVWSRHPPKEPPLNPVVWNAFSDHTLEKLPYPIFVTSLPKSGTTSVWKFFKCDRILSSHNWIKKRNSVQATPVGMCIEQNILNQRPPFEDCGDVDVYTDTGVSG